MDKKIRILVSSYLNSPYENRINTLYCLTYSLLAQTYNNFEIIIHHDGPLENKSLKDKFEQLDSRIKFICSESRKNNWGFHERYNLAIEDHDSCYILFTNDDNYYVPIFLESMINLLTNNKYNLAFCNLIHNERNYCMIDTYPEIGYIDLGCFISCVDLIKKIPWKYMHKEADGEYFKELYKISNPIKISNILFVHN